MSVRVLHGDCRDVLKTLPDQSVHCCITSPPYFGLRDYGVAGQIGLEPTPDAFVAEMVEVFREVRRVLRDDGTCWLNLGDSYSGGGGFSPNAPSNQSGSLSAQTNQRHNLYSGRKPAAGLKPKDLMMIPARVALALQADGWWLRKDIIWAKPNPMPESCTDRPTSSHEHVFLLAKSGDSLFWTHPERSGTRVQPEPDYRWVNRKTGEAVTTCPPGWPDEASKKAWRRINLWSASDYFYDAEAVREGRTSDEDANEFRGGCYVGGSIDNATTGRRKVVGNKRVDKQSGHSRRHAGFNDRWEASEEAGEAVGGRNMRDVWTIASHPLPEAHFATFPPALVEPCIKAGTSERGCCPTCAAPWNRIITKGEPDREHQLACGADASGGYAGQSTKNHAAVGVQDASAVKARILAGMRERVSDWRQGCACPPADPVPCVVLDPFGGAGTVALVADRLQRDAVLIELNPEYVGIARRRVTKDAGLFADILHA